MVRNLVPLLEILACLYCIAGTYGKKVRCNIYVVVFVIAIIFAFNHMPAYLVQRLTNGDMTGTGRFPMWITLAKEMFNNPLKMIVGFGTGSVKYYTGKGLVSHNTFLDVLFNEGILGFSIL